MSESSKSAYDLAGQVRAFCFPPSYSLLLLQLRGEFGSSSGGGSGGDCREKLTSGSVPMIKAKKLEEVSETDLSTE